MNNTDLRFVTSEDLKIVQEIIVAATEGIVSAEKENEFAAKIADWRRRYGGRGRSLPSRRGGARAMR